MQEGVLPALEYNNTNGDNCVVPNHEYMIGSFSSIFMSRNRVRSWDEQSFTIQAGGRHAPIHPQAPKMKFIEQNIRVFVPGEEHLYRRLSVRECARIQTFPNDFIFLLQKSCSRLQDDWKCSVPVNLAKFLANSIMQQIMANEITTKKVKQTEKLIESIAV